MAIILINIRRTYHRRWSPSRMVDSAPLSEFIEGLGPGQLVGRQVLGAPALGDIQLSLCHQKGFLEVEVIRARGLQVSVAKRCGSNARNQNHHQIINATHTTRPSVGPAPSYCRRRT